MSAKRRGLDPYTRDRRTPIEVLSMLAGRSNFTMRSDWFGARSGQPITALDVAHALAASRDKLGAAMGFSIACQRADHWPIVHRLGYARVLRDLTTQRDAPGAVDGAHRYRARMVLFDAFVRLIGSARRQSIRDAARLARVREVIYRILLRRATAILEDAAASAAADACRFLFANDSSPTPVTSATEVVPADGAVGGEGAMSQDLWTWSNEVECLFWHIGASRGRMVDGVLTLRTAARGDNVPSSAQVVDREAETAVFSHTDH